MGWLGNKIRGVKDWVCEKVEKAVDWVKDKLGHTSYSPSNIEDQIDVDKVLAEFRSSIQKDVSQAETECMESIITLFTNLKSKTRTKFPDLVEIIEREQKKAEKALAGTVMRYVKEHLSKNDAKFLEVLEMQPGSAKKNALEMAADRVIDEAEKSFNRKLKTYTEHIMKEFSDRLGSRIENQEKQMKKRIEEMQNLEEKAKKGTMNINDLRDASAPVMEVAECILYILEMEIGLE